VRIGISYFVGIEEPCGLRPSRSRTDAVFLLAATATGIIVPTCKKRS
jgi:hypothetical protein